MVIVGIHQPIFIPWIRYFHKIALTDSFVILDNVQFSKNDVQNRNYINSNNGKILLTIPVKKTEDSRIMNLKIFNNNWKRKHLNSLYYSYKNSPNFDQIFNAINDIYSKEFLYLSDFNSALLHFILEYLEINSKILKSSNMSEKPGKTDRLVNICKELKATHYIVGKDGKYLEREKFLLNKIDIVRQPFIHPTYFQMHSNKLKDLSILDWMFQDSRNNLIGYFKEERKKFDENYTKLGAFV